MDICTGCARMHLLRCRHCSVLFVLCFICTPDVTVDAVHHNNKYAAAGAADNAVV
jgi:hypothetical protein